MINDLCTWQTIFVNLILGTIFTLCLVYNVLIIDSLGIKQLLFSPKATLISQCVNELIKRNIQFTYESKGLSNNLFCVIHNEEFYDNSISFHFYFKDKNQVVINCIDHSSDEKITKNITEFNELLKFKPFTN